MDMTTILGILIALIGLIGGYAMDGGHVSALFVPSALLIVFGGTIGAVVVSFPKSHLKLLPQAIKMAFSERSDQSEEIIEDLVNMATMARREGVLALEQRAADHEEPFLRNGLMMVVDGTDPELTRQILELDMESTEHTHERFAKIFESAGGYAPTMGIIGTVLGLIHVLGSLSNPDSLGPAIAVAFTATLYGVASANVIYLPIASKIKVRSADQISNMELMLEGVLSIQAGENPALIRKKLYSFLHSKDNGAHAKAGGTLAEEK